LTYLLDTNIVWQTSKFQPDEKVMSWWFRQQASSMMVSAIVFQELRYGIERLDPGRKRDRLDEWLEVQMRQQFSGRILPITVEIADQAGRLIATTTKAGHTPDIADSLIAATAIVHGMTIATLNRDHFEWLDVELVEF
jgi:predicted nucleic acid-binding protein